MTPEPLQEPTVSDGLGGLPDLAGTVSALSVRLPGGYHYGVTRYADVILRQAFPTLFDDLTRVLAGYSIDASEILSGGGARATQTARFDSSLEAKGWGKKNIVIEKRLDGEVIHQTKGHEIDMFAPGSPTRKYPGVALEVEWNNKDPFFDRDLLNFQALHREGAIAIGIIVTRGPELQTVISNTVYSSATAATSKYGQSTTHWDKLVPRVNLGGGGECPLLLIGIETDRVTNFHQILAAYETHGRIWRLTSP
jgi:hypothetical protein